MSEKATHHFGYKKSQSSLTGFLHFNIKSKLLASDFHTDSAWTFFTLTHFEFNFVAILWLLAFYFRDVEEQIVSAVSCDKSKTFAGIKKLYCTCTHLKKPLLIVVIIWKKITQFSGTCDENLRKPPDFCLLTIFIPLT
jgi:hypothetical protein